MAADQDRHHLAWLLGIILFAMALRLLFAPWL